jgi:hypothetical protein
MNIIKVNFTNPEADVFSMFFTKLCFQCKTPLKDNLKALCNSCINKDLSEHLSMCVHCQSSGMCDIAIQIMTQL